MRIAELEAHHDEYAGLEASIRTMLHNHEFPAVFSVCEESFPHIVPAIKYRKRKGIEPETPALVSLHVITKYAPPLFEHAALESLCEFVRSQTTLARHENGYLRAAESALEDEEIARALWNHLEAHLGFPQRDIGEDLGFNQERVVAIVDTWVELGVISRTKEKNNSGLFFRCRLDAEAEGICQTCGVRGKGRRELFFRPISCQKCGTQGYYHITYAGQQ